MPKVVDRPKEIYIYIFNEWSINKTLGRDGEAFGVGFEKGYGQLH